MFNQSKKNGSPVQKLKQTIGTWMFGILTQMSRDQFSKILTSMDTDPKLFSIKTRILSIRAAYKDLCQHCTENQMPYVGKPFFYGIKFSTSQQEGGDEGQQLCQIIFDVDHSTQRVADVGGRINNPRDFATFGNLVAGAIMPNQQKKDIADQLSKEEQIIKEALQQIHAQDNEGSTTQVPQTETSNGQDGDNIDLSYIEDSEVDEEPTKNIGCARKLEFKTAAQKAEESKKNIVDAMQSKVVEELEERRNGQVIQKAKLNAQRQVEEALARSTRVGSKR